MPAQRWVRRAPPFGVRGMRPARARARASNCTLAGTHLPPPKSNTHTPGAPPSCTSPSTTRSCSVGPTSAARKSATLESRSAALAHAPTPPSTAAIPSPSPPASSRAVPAARAHRRTSPLPTRASASAPTAVVSAPASSSAGAPVVVAARATPAPAQQPPAGVAAAEAEAITRERSDTRAPQGRGEEGRAPLPRLPPRTADRIAAVASAARFVAQTHAWRAVRACVRACGGKIRHHHACHSVRERSHGGGGRRGATSSCAPHCARAVLFGGQAAVAAWGASDPARERRGWTR